MRMPTVLGDVLILQTETGVRIHAVGRATKAGQQDFHHSEAPIYIVDHAEAIAAARRFVAPGCKIFLLILEGGDWSEITP
jgi:hypothetical protein